ncbi:MAG: tRNA (cytidine(34)-2'-O)-methyltransferase [Planctomycetaceae bacterium]|jgi:tRNA (cytidine/uridine-2'-O-)-methyltransferase|nr:tRNA (cytidine(34)-2'-O)-methyltransferase [Planctomycetaceae bacterium]
MNGTKTADFHIVLYQPEIPDNTGAVGRTCVAVGAKLWLVRPLGFQMDHRRIKRAGLDYWEHLDVQVADDWSDLTQHLSGHRFWFLSKKGNLPYTEAVFRRKDVFVFGGESRGLPESMLESHKNQSLRIPIHSAARSLNLSVSVGVIAFEFQRQRKGRL